MRLGSRNPIFRSARYDQVYDDASSASYFGVVTKTSLLLAVMAFVAVSIGSTFEVTAIDAGTIGLLIGAPLIAFIAAIVTHAVPRIGVVTAFIYAIAEGAFLGVISAIYTFAYSDQIVQVALLATFGVMAAMLFLYSTGLVRVGQFFRRFMYSVLGGLILVSLIMLLVVLFGVGLEAFYSIYVAVVVISVIAASLFLLIDFDRITRYVEMGVGKSAEWSLSMGLITTLVWLYLDLLRLLAIITRRR